MSIDVFAADEQSDRPVDLARWVGLAEAVLAASIFHFGEFTVGQAHEYLRARGVRVRDQAPTPKANP